MGTFTHLKNLLRIPRTLQRTITSTRVSTMEPDPVLYSKNCAVPIRLATEVLETAQLQQTSYPNVLDIGCGTGEVTNVVCEKVPGIKQMIAYDKTMVDFAAIHNPREQIKYVMADIESRETLPQEWTWIFNLVTSFLALHWVTDQHAVLKEVNRNLTPGGEFLFFISHVVKPLRAIGRQIGEHPRWRTYFEGFVPGWLFSPHWQQSQWGNDPVQGYTDFVKRAGLETVSVEVSEMWGTYPDVNSCIERLQGLVPHVKRIPSEETADFMADVLDIYRQALPLSPEGQFQWCAEYLVVHGIKP